MGSQVLFHPNVDDEGIRSILADPTKKIRVIIPLLSEYGLFWSIKTEPKTPAMMNRARESFDAFSSRMLNGKKRECAVAYEFMSPQQILNLDDNNNNLTVILFDLNRIPLPDFSIVQTALTGIIRDFRMIDATLLSRTVPLPSFDVDISPFNLTIVGASLLPKVLDIVETYTKFFTKIDWLFMALLYNIQSRTEKDKPYLMLFYGDLQPIVDYLVGFIDSLGQTTLPFKTDEDQKRFQVMVEFIKKYIQLFIGRAQQQHQTPTQHHQKTGSFTPDQKQMIRNLVKQTHAMVMTLYGDAIKKVDAKLQQQSKKKPEEKTKAAQTVTRLRRRIGQQIAKIKDPVNQYFQFMQSRPDMTLLTRLWLEFLAFILDEYGRFCSKQGRQDLAGLRRWKKKLQSETTDVKSEILKHLPDILRDMRPYWIPNHNIDQQPDFLKDPLTSWQTLKDYRSHNVMFWSNRFNCQAAVCLVYKQPYEFCGALIPHIEKYEDRTNQYYTRLYSDELKQKWKKQWTQRKKKRQEQRLKKQDEQRRRPERYPCELFNDSGLISQQVDQIMKTLRPRSPWWRRFMAWLKLWRLEKQQVDIQTISDAKTLRQTLKDPKKSLYSFQKGQQTRQRLTKLITSQKKAGSPPDLTDLLESIKRFVPLMKTTYQTLKPVAVYTLAQKPNPYILEEMSLKQNHTTEQSEAFRQISQAYSELRSLLTLCFEGKLTNNTGINNPYTTLSKALAKLTVDDFEKDRLNDAFKFCSYMIQDLEHLVYRLNIKHCGFRDEYNKWFRGIVID